MNFRPIGRAALALALVFSGSLALGGFGCSEGGGAKSAMVHASDMPAGESWNGVYFHPVFGYLHLVENDATVVGKWQRADKSKWGELSGTKIGNLLHFTWKEHTYGLVGPAALRVGKGVFVYKTEEVNEHKQAKLEGEFGLEQDEVGSTWNCVKQDRMEPKLDSINGDVGATGAPAAAGKWDEK
jgi:hypothetical protein